MKRRNVRTLSLIVATFTYLLIGAAVFDALEGPHNEMSFEALTQIKGDIMSKYNMTEEDYKLMELIVIERKPHKNGPQWKFAGSFYYALVVLTLIGYGHSTPNTAFGKAFTMGYAAFGIPAAMVMFQSMGERMNKAFSVIIRHLRSILGCARTEATEFDLIFSSMLVSSIVIGCGALLYHTQEGWSLFDSVYYTFITLSTIGFGDFVALQDSKALQFQPGYVACSFIFLLLGLASLSSSINLLVLRFMILSLEDDEDQEELMDVAQNVITLDGEVMAVNGKVLAGHHQQFDRQFNAGREPDAASVCSCTCYAGSLFEAISSRAGHQASLTRGQSSRQRRTSSRRHRRKNKTFPANILNFFTWMKKSGDGHHNPGHGGEEINNTSDSMSQYYDEENQSINNYARFRVKRASF